MPEHVRLRDVVREKGKALFSGRMDVEIGGLTGVLHWSDGQILDVRLGTTTGEPALWRMLLADRSRIVVEPGRPRATGGAVLGKPDALLARFEERLLVLARTAEKVGGLERVWAIRFDALARVLDELPDAINPVLRLLDGKRTVRHVVAECGLDDMLALRILQKLLAQGLLTLPENESALPQDAPPGELVDEGLEAALAASLEEPAPIPLVPRAPTPMPSPAPALGDTQETTPAPASTSERHDVPAAAALPSAPRPATQDDLRSWLGNEEAFFADVRSAPPTGDVVVPSSAPAVRDKRIGVVPMVLLFLLAVGLGALLARFL